MPHRLSQYQAALAPVLVQPWAGEDPVITQVTYDSRQVVPGALFICKGVHFTPAYLAQAVERGAAAWLGATAYPEGTGLPGLVVSDLRQAIATCGTLFYNREWDALTIIGVTGTKGKTTTTFFIQSILAAWMAQTGGPAPGVISSIRVQDGVLDVPSVKTTPETLELYAHLHNATQADLRYLCLEASSQGLRYQRVANVTFEVGCFLNVSEDHISAQEHPDFEDYLSAKLGIFDQSRQAVYNAATDQVERVRTASVQCRRVVTFALHHQGQACPADVIGCDLVDLGGADGLQQEFTVRLAGASQRAAIGLRGTFNVENALAAIAVAHCLGVPWPAVRAGLAATCVPGRMQVWQLNRGTRVVVDYAHQRLSLEALLASVRHDWPDSPIVMVFGASGDKGWNRWEELGTLAGRHAGAVYLTEDDPGDLPVVEICRGVDQYIRATGHPGAQIVPDRPTAIRRALAEAADDALVLLLGKGAERWQIRGPNNGPTPSDIDILEQWLAEQPTA
jgi:UDP-N-acetylmuramoyl-L-alanyl-D-glutamate--2,6-diaminopimelate ligase